MASSAATPTPDREAADPGRRTAAAAARRSRREPRAGEVGRAVASALDGAVDATAPARQMVPGIARMAGGAAVRAAAAHLTALLPPGASEALAGATRAAAASARGTSAPGGTTVPGRWGSARVVDDEPTVVDAEWREVP